MKYLDEFIEFKTFEKRIIDINDMKKIVDYYIDKFGLWSFVREKVICLNETNDKLVASYYNPSELRLVFFMKILNDQINNSYYQIHNQYPNVDFINYYNYSILVSIFHELLHVMQYKQVFLKEEMDDHILDLYFLSYVLQRKYADYEKYITLFPVEREAIITSHDIVFLSFAKLDSSMISKDDLHLFQKMMVSNLVRDYHGKLVIKSPCENLMKIFDSDLYSESLKKGYMQLYQRLVYGLSITRREYYNVLSLYNEIDNGLNPRESIKSLILKRG